MQLVFNSLAPGKFEWKFIHSFQTDFSYWWLRHLLWKCPNMNVTGLHWWSVNIGSGNGLVPSGNQCWLRSLSPYGVTRPQWVMLEFFYCIIWHQKEMVVVFVMWWWLWWWCGGGSGVVMRWWWWWCPVVSVRWWGIIVYICKYVPMKVTFISLHFLNLIELADCKHYMSSYKNLVHVCVTLHMSSTINLFCVINPFSVTGL